MQAEPGRALPPAPEASPLSGLLDPASPDPEMREQLRAWMRFQDALCLSPVRAQSALLAEQGNPRAALARCRGTAVLSAGQIEAAMDQLAQAAMRALPLSSDAYPERLRALPDPPALLWVRGDPTLLSRPAVAIVGARAATRYGLAVATELATALGRAGLVVVSGLARGIDGAAHRATLDAGGATVAVQGCGPDRVYPPEHAGLADRIAESGAVLSELAPGRPPAAAHFPLRNRIISLDYYYALLSNTFSYD